MKWFRSALIAGAVSAALLTVAARADLAHWVQTIEAGKPLEGVLFKRVTLGTATLAARRPPSETRPELSKLIAASPNDAELYAARAREAEQQIDAPAAEADWIRYAQLAKDKFAAQMELADFYHRRVEPAKELAALSAAARIPAIRSERFDPVPEQSAWKTFERSITLIDDHLLGFEAAQTVFRAWIARFPGETVPYARYLDYALAHRNYSAAEQAARDYAAGFPDDAVFSVQAQARIEAARGSTQTALALYDRAFQPLWPPELVKSYFELLTKTGSLRKYLADARAKADTIAGTSRIFYYWQQQGNLANAQRALLEFESRNPKLTAADRGTVAQLYEAANNPDQAARAYYALYTMNGVSAADSERALAGIANVLFSYAGQGIRFGAGDLSYYRDIAQADPYPGYLNGILSLILNTSEPVYKYSAENQQAQAYFHRARASELLTLFDSRFPNSARRPALHAKRVNAYAVHGDNAAVIRAGLDFRKQFPTAPERTEVATLMAEAYARTGQTAAEFALYDQLLQELGARAEGVPLGSRAGLPQPAAAANQPPTQQAPAEAPAQPVARPRSPEYARILDRYIARLVSLKRLPDALALYRRQIDRNPNDAGLYARLAAFLEQNRMGADVEATYRRAMTQFPDTTWSHKLARWYLRQKQTTQLAALTRDVTAKFSGTELEAYFKAVVPRGSIAASLYLQLNLYAHQRFPHDLVFTRNLLTAYQARGTADPAAYEALLRANWLNADDLRTRFFEYLSRNRKLDAEVTAAGAITTPQQVNANPVAAQMVADGQAWRAHFENAAPVYRLLAATYPASPAVSGRAATLYRSLATIDPKQSDVAAGIEQNLVAYAPGDAATLTTDGEIYADRDRFDRARPVWNRIAVLTPGRAQSYLESATIFWDYFLYDDALRILQEGRRRLNDPSLFAYEAGAIYENRRQYDRALQEYASAALSQSSDIAQRRLVRLARRPALRDNIERLTADLADRADATSRAIGLRAAILDNQGRRADLETFLVAAAGRTNAFETLDAIEAQGRVSGFAKVQETAMLRRSAITSDPVDQMRYQLALVHFYEDQARAADAQRVLTALYQAHPTTMGVVRATTDYYWRTAQPKRAVQTLTEAATRAQPVYRNAFRLEAARKATESGDTAAARQTLALLLKDEPYRSDYLTAMADTYARAGDDKGLRAFYQSTLDSLRTSNLPSADKTERSAAMRRGLIPVLTRVRDYSAGLDQYIEIVNRYPEDESVAREAAAYAAAHGLGAKLVDYYVKTSATSPKDYRWPMVLARVDSELERFPEAIDAYSKATTIRPDRTDLWIAQAQLQERLFRFSDAERNYARLFELTYRNAAWMERVAIVRARQGQKDGALAALKTAFIENRPERASNYFSVASRLAGWGNIAEAQQFAEKGAEVAGPELMSDSESAIAYARVMAQARKHEAAYARMIINGVEPDKAPALSSALQAMGTTARELYTPEEKSAFGAFFEKQRKPGSRMGLEAVEAAGLEDVTVAWLMALARANPADEATLNQLAEHQRRRIHFSEWGGQLEALWKATPAQTENRDALLVRAAEAYRQAGDARAELRLIRQKKSQSGIEGVLVERFCQLLVQQPQALLNVAASDSSDVMRDMAANCAIANARPADALNTIAARGKGLPPVWTAAYTGITGLYLALTTQPVRDAFLQALGSPVIGDRVGKPGDRDKQLAGERWFYYGARYGDFLALSRQPDASDYLSAMVEGRPGSSAAYYDLAESYREAGDNARALAEYGHSLELDPLRGAAHDRIADAMWNSGNHDGAVAEWKLALEAFGRQQDRGAAPPSFWQDVKTTLTHIGQRNVLTAVKPEADTLLKTYLRRNGTYQFEPLLEGVLAAAGEAAKGVAWLAELSRSAADPMAVLALAVRSEAVADAQRDALYQKLIEYDESKLASAFGQPRENAEASLRTWQIEWLRSLVARKQTERARALLASIPESARKSRFDQVTPLELQVAAQSSAIPATLARYASASEAPPLAVLRNAAGDLKRQGYEPASRRVLEYVYTRELQARHFDAANFLGLAEIQLQENQFPAALETLRRMTMLSGEPFDTLLPAANLLIQFKRDSEAATFLEQRVKATPWDKAAQTQLAALRKDTKALTAVASDAQAPYASRAEAAIQLRRNGGVAITSGAPELDLLASSVPLPEAAVKKPYWYRARVEAAAQVKEAALKLALLSDAIAIDPDPAPPRLLLFRTALDLKRYSLAISAMPLQGDAANAVISDYETGTFLQNTPFGLAERTMVARGLGDAYARLNDPARAVHYYRLAIALDAGQRRALEPVLTAVEAASALQQENAARRPVVSSNLEQPNVVRPRLTIARGGNR